MRYLATLVCTILIMASPLAAQYGHETKDKHFILEVNPVSHVLGFGGTVNGSILFNGMSLNAEYQVIGGPYSIFDFMDEDLEGVAYTGSLGWYPQWSSYGYNNSVFFELGYGTLEMDYTDDLKNEYSITGSGPMAKVGVRFTMGMVTVSGALNGHLYFTDVEQEQSGYMEDDTSLYTGSYFMTYNVMLSFGIAI